MPATTGLRNVFLSRPIMSSRGIIQRENAMAGKSSTKSKKPSYEAFVVTGGQSAVDLANAIGAIAESVGRVPGGTT